MSKSLTNLAAMLRRDDPQALQARARLLRLDAMLEQDPQNELLMQDAFESARYCGDWESARKFLSLAQTRWPTELNWILRESDLLLAQKQFSQARTVLTNVLVQPEAPVEFQSAVQQNLAYACFCMNDFAAAVRILEPLMEQRPPLEAENAKAIWLRSLHQTTQLSRALMWATTQDQQHQLDASVAGVASLIALDCEDMVNAQKWSSVAIAASTPQPIEALVTQASLALATRNAKLAQKLATAALSIQPDDGRTWSVMAFCALLDRRLDQALINFSRALAGIPTHIGTWHGQGWTFILKGDLNQAQTSFESALALDHNFGESHGGLAIVLAMKHETESAQAHIERARRLDKANLAGRYAQAILDGETSNPAALQALVERLLKGKQSPLESALPNSIKPRP